MNKLFKRTLNIISICVMIMMMNLVVFAQGTTTISVTKGSASVGDSITVSISATESGTITVKYTASMLNLTSCSASGYSAEGNSVTFSGKSGDLVFNAASNGTASIIVSSSSCSGSSTTINIGGEATSSNTTTTTNTAEVTTETESETPETVEEPETTEVETPVETTSSSSAGTLNSNGGFDINGIAYVVSERYSDAEMPSGFSKTTVKIGSSTYSEPTNGSITLLYLKPADNTSGSGEFYVYDEAAGTVSKFVMLGTADKYVLVKENGDVPSAAFTATTINVDGTDISAYTIDGAEFFYVYGTNQDQAEGWFVYDQTYGTVSRVDTSALASGSSESEDDGGSYSSNNDNTIYIEKLALYRKIIMGLIILCVILVFIIINKLIKNRGDDDDDFDGDVFAKTPSKPSRRLPRSIVFDHDDYDDEEDSEDEDYDDEEEYVDDDYDDEDDYSTSEATYEEKRDASLNMMDLNDL